MTRVPFNEVVKMKFLKWLYLLYIICALGFAYLLIDWFIVPAAEDIREHYEWFDE